MMTKLAALALVLTSAAPAMARTYKPMTINQKDYRVVTLHTPPCCDIPSTNALIAKKGSGSILLERAGGWGPATFSKVNINSRKFTSANVDLSKFKATPIQNGFVNPDFPRLTLLTAKDGSGKAYIERSGGFTANPQPVFSALNY